MVANEVAITGATTSVHDGAGAHGSPAAKQCSRHLVALSIAQHAQEVG